MVMELRHNLQVFHQALLAEGFVLEIDPCHVGYMDFRFQFAYTKPELNWSAEVVITPHASGEILRAPETHVIYHQIELKVWGKEWNFSAQISTVDPNFNKIEEVLQIFQQLAALNDTVHLSGL